MKPPKKYECGHEARYIFVKKDLFSLMAFKEWEESDKRICASCFYKKMKGDKI
jgi:hypothetical protein